MRLPSFPTGFLLTGLALVSLFTTVKSKSSPPSEKSNLQSSFQHIAPIPSHEALQIEVGGAQVFISKYPISNHQFAQFVEETGYRTWREKQLRYPNWRYPQVENLSDIDQESTSLAMANDAPANWLTQGDAIAYCRWVSEKQGALSAYDFDSTAPWTQKGCRLPTSQELEHLQNQTNLSDWEWTSQTLANWNSSFASAMRYTTAWSPTEPPRHRKVEDMTDEEFHNTHFRIAWTISPSPRPLADQG